MNSEDLRFFLDIHQKIDSHLDSINKKLDKQAEDIEKRLDKYESDFNRKIERYDDDINLLKIDISSFRLVKKIVYACAGLILISFITTGITTWAENKKAVEIEKSLPKQVLTSTIKPK